MKFTNEEKKQIIEGFLQNIFCASNKEYQWRVWIKGEGPECDDFDEFMNYFSLEGEDIIKNYKNFNITDKQYHLAKKLWDEVDTFDASTERPYLPQDFIDTPEWTKITELAKDVLVAFDWKPTHKL